MANNPAEPKINPWMRIDGGYLYISRCDWIYPQATENDAGPRDESRYEALGQQDGDIVIRLNPDARVDTAHLKLMIESLWK